MNGTAYQAAAAGQFDRAVGATGSLPATERQVSFIVKLTGEKDWEELAGGKDYAIIKTALRGEEISKREASSVIDWLMSLRRKPSPAGNTQTQLEAGIYLLQGAVYKVQKAVHGSGNLYAKRLEARAGEKGQFVYVPGAIKQIRPEHKMTLDQAKEFGAIYGVCCNCGRTLTNEVSIEAGIGPVCAGRFA